MFLAEMQLILKLTGKTADFLPPNLLSIDVFLPRVDYWEKLADILGLVINRNSDWESTQWFHNFLAKQVLWLSEYRFTSKAFEQKGKVQQKHLCVHAYM